MENGQKTNGSMRPVERYDIGHVQEVIRQAHGELRQLLQQRAEIMKRIGTVKQTISGLANLFGDELLSEELMELVDRKNSGRQPGFHQGLPNDPHGGQARHECARHLRLFPAENAALLARHKDPTASVTTVLNRLVEYGEAQAVVSNGRRAWLWIAEEPAEVPRIHEEPRLVANVG